MNAANEGHHDRTTQLTAPADPRTEMSEEEISEIIGPARPSSSDWQPHSA
jgi:hypothetical protein